MKMRFLAVAWTLVATSVAWGRLDLLLVPPAEAVPGKKGERFILYLNNPTELDDVADLPVRPIAEIATEERRDHVVFEWLNSEDRVRRVKARTREKVELVLTRNIESAGKFVSLRLIEPQTNAMMFELETVSPVARSDAGGIATADGLGEKMRALFVPGRDIDLATDVDNTRRHISAYDPIYFAIGWRERLNARFQFSFKYRVFEPGPRGEEWWKRAVRDFHVAYTQTSIWDLETFSKPFYDSSYKPTAFLLHEFPIDADLRWRTWLQTGVQHESNGKGGGSAPALTRDGLLSTESAARHPSDSRSLNSVYVVTKTKWANDDGFFVEAALRANAYFQTDENPDIDRYRGHLGLTFRTGYDRGFQLALDLRGSVRGHGSAEFNATWPAARLPILRHLLPDVGGYAQIQYFNGYGESLVDYDVRRKDQLRFGMMLVR